MILAATAEAAAANETNAKPPARDRSGNVALKENAMDCPSTMALAVALVPGVEAEEVRLGQLLGLAITLVIAVSCQLALAMI
jgi:hypothetical protein